jgi:hypothetical protein
MPYFNCFLAGSWMFVIGWYVGAIYMQDRDEKMRDPQASKEAEVCGDWEAWRVPIAVTAAD